MNDVMNDSLTNLLFWYFISSSDCECEKTLKTCLSKFNETTLSSTNLLKKIYFTVKTQCFTLVNGEAVLMDSSKYQENVKNNEYNNMNATN